MVYLFFTRKTFRFQVGFNKGDGINYSAVPISGTIAVQDIEHQTDVGIPGQSF